MPIETIDDVLSGLDAIIARAHEDKSRCGFFAALYRRVTRRVKAGILAGRFEDGARMDLFDSHFAGRYLAPFDAYRNGRPAPASWSLAFRACDDAGPCVLQHLMAGMNAHINMDLGPSAAAVAPGAALESLRRDFNEINSVLSEETLAVENALATLSPALAMLRDAALLDGNLVINFSMGKARDFAWMTAQEFAANPGDQEARLARLDMVVSALGQTVLHPPLTIAMKLKAVRALETNDIRRIIEALA